jgi:hypothetical protein
MRGERARNDRARKARREGDVALRLRRELGDEQRATA